MQNLLSKKEINQFQKNGAVFIKGKFDKRWIEKLRNGIDIDINNPSPRFVNHTKDTDLPGYYEDFWTWNLYPEFKDFVFNSPTSKMASELLGASRINLVMDNWFYREAGSKSSAPFHHDITYFDFEGSMCVLWLPLEPVSKEEGIAWIKGSHLWNKLFVRTRFNDGQTGGEMKPKNGVLFIRIPPVLVQLPCRSVLLLLKSEYICEGGWIFYL